MEGALLSLLSFCRKADNWWTLSPRQKLCPMPPLVQNPNLAPMTSYSRCSQRAARNSTPMGLSSDLLPHLDLRRVPSLDWQSAFSPNYNSFGKSFCFAAPTKASLTDDNLYTRKYLGCSFWLVEGYTNIRTERSIDWSLQYGLNLYTNAQ